MIKNKSCIILFLLLFSQFIKADNKDSLLNIISYNKTDTNTIKALSKLGDIYLKTRNDSCFFYYNKGLKIANQINNKKLLCKTYLDIGYAYIIFLKYNKSDKYIKTALIINNKFLKNNSLYSSIYNNLGILYKHKNDSKKAIEYFLKSIKYDKITKDSTGEAKSFINIANIYVSKGDFNKALKYYNLSKNILINFNDIKTLSKCYNGIGVVYYMKGNYDKAIEYFHNTLETKEKLNDLHGMSLCYNNIGLVHYEQKNYYQSINYYNKALEIFKKQKNEIGIANEYSNIGIIYSDKGENEKALNYYLLALEIFKKLNDNYNAANTYANLGNIYLTKKDFKKSKKYLEKALEIKQKNNNKDGIANIFINLSNLNNSLGDSTGDLKYYKKAIFFANKGLKIAKDIGTKPNEKIAYESLSNSYYKLNDIKKSYKYLKLFIQVKDSLFNIKKMQELENLEAKYQNKQKQEEIEKNKIIIAKNEAEKKQLKIQESKQRMQKRFFIAGFVFVLIISFYIFKNYKQKKKANALLKEQKAQIQEKNAELNQQNEEILTQRDEIEKQKNKIEIIHNNLSESINYAKNIQKSILPDFNILNNIFTENFLYFKPKDVVSGDFYWWSKIDNYFILTIADCTGHGVPGAFMSMLGISFLREIVNKEKITQPDKILNKLRKEIILTLKQTGKEGEQKDGMDMSIISLNLENNVLQYSGANNPIYIVKNKKIKTDKNIVLFDDSKINTQNLKFLYEIKADKMPIGIYKRTENFSLKEIKLNNGDFIYLFSDGFADQFGGEKNKKFKYKPFKRLLISNSNKTANEQKLLLEKTLIEWKKNNYQIDDITVMGIKI